MIKKIIFVFGFLGLAYFSVSDLSNNYFDKPCPFCNEAVYRSKEGHLAQRS